MSVLSKLSTINGKNPTPVAVPPGTTVLLSRTPWLGLAINVTCVTSQYFSPPPPTSHRHNNVNPLLPSEHDVIYGRPHSILHSLRTHQTNRDLQLNQRWS